MDQCAETGVVRQEKGVYILLLNQFPEFRQTGKLRFTWTYKRTKTLRFSLVISRTNLLLVKRGTGVDWRHNWVLWQQVSVISGTEAGECGGFWEKNRAELWQYWDEITQRGFNINLGLCIKCTQWGYQYCVDINIDQHVTCVIPILGTPDLLCGVPPFEHTQLSKVGSLVSTSEMLCQAHCSASQLLFVCGS